MAPIDSLRRSYDLDAQIEDYLFQIEHNRNDAPYYKVLSLLNSLRYTTRRRLLDAVTSEFVAADTEAIKMLMAHKSQVGSLSFDWNIVQQLTVKTLSYLESALNSVHAHAIKVKRASNDPFAQSAERPKRLVKIANEGKKPHVTSLKNYSSLILTGTASRARALAVARRAKLSNLGLTIFKGSATKESKSPCQPFLDKVFAVDDNPDYPPLSDLPNGGCPIHPNCSAFLELYFP